MVPFSTLKLTLSYQCVRTSDFVYMHISMKLNFILICLRLKKERPINFTFSLTWNKNTKFCPSPLMFGRSEFLSIKSSFLHNYREEIISHHWIVKTIFIKCICNTQCWLVKSWWRQFYVAIILNFDICWLFLQQRQVYSSGSFSQFFILFLLR